MRAAVVGAGPLGTAVAEELADAGCDVVLHSRRAAARIGFVERGSVRARTTGSFEGFEDREIVIEAVAEDLALKADTLRTIEARCPPDTVIASTAAAAPIRALAAEADHPGRVLGLHFVAPGRAVRLVEVVSTPWTTPVAVAEVMLFADMLGRTPLRVPDVPGFLVNRLLLPALLEVCRLCAEHAATPEEIDHACRRAGMCAGPARLLDLIGLDVALRVARSCARTLGAAYAPPPFLERCVAAGRLGRRVRRGLYAYPADRPEPDPALDALRAEAERAAGEPPPGEVAIERLLLALGAAALTCLADGIASPADIDAALVGTTGASHGALARCRHLGEHGLLARVDALVGEFGERFALRADVLEALPTLLADR